MVASGDHCDVGGDAWIDVVRGVATYMGRDGYGVVQGNGKVIIRSEDGKGDPVAVTGVIRVDNFKGKEEQDTGSCVWQLTLNRKYE